MVNSSVGSFRHGILIASLTCLAGAAFGQTHPRSEVERINKELRLTPIQRTNVDPIVQKHEDRQKTLREDPSISAEVRRDRIREDEEALQAEMKPLLNEDQAARLGDVLHLNRSWLHFQLAAVGSVLYPTDSLAKQIFGSSISSYGLGFEGYQAQIGSRSRFSVTAGLFSLGGTNRLFVGAAVGHYEYRVPITRRAYMYANVFAGPAYMDYSFNLPDGEHFGAKRLGAEGGAELGVKWGILRVAVYYQAFTQPAGVNFDGIGASVTVTLLHLAFP